MAKIHMILQGKGGVGKSFIATILAQYLLSKGQKPKCIDTDPVNATFSGFKALEVQRIHLMEDDEINPRNFDALVELIAGSKHDVVIDNGASSFVPLSHYLVTNEVAALLKSMGHQLVIHTVITGSQALVDTMQGFSQVVKQFPAEAMFAVWLNPYWGPIENEGKTFESMKVYTDNKDRVTAILNMPTLKKETFGRDLSDMLQGRQTFNEAIADKTLTIMSKQRLTLVRDQLFNELKAAVVL